MKFDVTESVLRIELPVVGKIRMRDTAEVGWTSWSLGCETLDRDFADYDKYKEFITPLGVSTIRLQAGWAKCERIKGKYDFAWLDHIIDDARSRGLNILLETDYGNPVYAGGGGHDLLGSFPSSSEAVQAWDNWVRTLAEHFRGRVHDWAMWNEPDGHGVSAVTNNNLRTASIIKAAIPDARIAGLTLALPDPEFFEECIRAFEKAGKLELFTWFIYHGYRYNPDLSYGDIRAMQDVLRRYGSKAILRQGENGCPSNNPGWFALRGHDWSEFTQAKWDLRRYLGDYGHGVESSIFTICDFQHVGREVNRKGLLLADEDHNVIRPKQVYGAVSRMISVFDGSMQSPQEHFFVRADNLRLKLEGSVSVSAGTDTYAFPCSKKDGSGNLTVYWDCSGVPTEETACPTVQVHTFRLPIDEPVLCDLISGNVYAVPDFAIHRDGNAVSYDLPLSDAPLILAEKNMLPLENENKRNKGGA